MGSDTLRPSDGIFADLRASRLSQAWSMKELDQEQTANLTYCELLEFPMHAGRESALLLEQPLKPSLGLSDSR